MFVIIQNGQVAKKKSITLIRKLSCEIFLRLLWDEGYLLGYKVVSESRIKVFLKYTSDGIPTITSIKSMLTSNQKSYLSVEQIRKLGSSKSLFILSTNKGLISASQCKYHNIGGKLVACVY